MWLQRSAFIIIFDHIRIYLLPEIKHGPDVWFQSIDLHPEQKQSLLADREQACGVSVGREPIPLPCAASTACCFHKKSSLKRSKIDQNPITKAYFCLKN